MCRMAEHGGSTGCRKFDHLIAVTSRHLCQPPFRSSLSASVGITRRLLSYGKKDLMEDDYLFFAKDALTICREHGVRCVLHTFTRAALQLDHPYLHLPLAALQKEGGKPDGIRILGSSIHSVSEAQEAERLGADYLTAGHIYATDCKAGVPPRGLDFLEEVCRSVQIPVYGIGGVRIGSGPA